MTETKTLPKEAQELQELNELRETVRKHDHLYYISDSAIITDAEYDQLYRRLVELEERYPEATDSNSPTKRIGGISVGSGFVKVKHVNKMLSLRNVMTPDTALSALGVNHEIVLEPKVDGLSLKLLYVNGELKQAITRGDGEVGDDVTANARTIRTVPLKLFSPIDLEVTGEVYMRCSVFNLLNDKLTSEGKDPYSNVRNAASGILKLKNPLEVAACALSFAVHGSNTEFDGVTTYDMLVEVLGDLGFKTMWQLPVLQSTSAVASSLGRVDLESLEEAIENADTSRRNLDLATDGLVLKINSLEAQRELGAGNKYPRWAVAYKFPPERKSTTLLGITLQVGKSGKITPVAELRPVIISGTLVKRASLCNQNEIDRLEVNLGDEVYIEKSAEIIPKVMGVASKTTAGAYSIPLTCPCCLGVVTREEGLVDLFCRNRDCKDQVIARLRHATSKAALDLDGCGDTMISVLVDLGVRKLSDIFAIDEKKLHVLKPAARKKLLAGREAAKTQPFWRQLYALGIDGVGAETCKVIAGTWSSLLEIVASDDGLPKLLELIKPSAYANFVDYIVREQDEIQRLEDLGFTFSAAPIIEGPLAGKTFVITGALMSGSRINVTHTIESLGGAVNNNVSSKAHYLIVGEAPGDVKVKQAAKNNVPVISEDQLYALMGIPMPAAVVREPDEDM